MGYNRGINQEAGREDKPACAAIEHRMEEVMKYSDKKVTDLLIFRLHTLEEVPEDGRGRL